MDFWNILDFSRNILLWVYATLHWESVSDHTKMLIISVITLLSWGRGIGYFRILGATRYLIRMILEVAKDMWAFLLILLILTFVFGILIYSATDKSSFTIARALLHAYRINYSDFDTEEYDEILGWLFVIATLFNPLIMLNLLIAVMGDTYDRVRDGLVIADHKEMASLILEVETLLFWRRNTEDWGFI